VYRLHRNPIGGSHSASAGFVYDFSPHGGREDDIAEKVAQKVESADARQS
jgi:hypothetical protein